MLHTVKDRQNGWRGIVLAVLVLLALGAAAARPTGADDTGLSYAVYVDRSATMTLGDVQAAPFRPVTAMFGGGFSTSAYWLRVTFDAPDLPPIMLRFRPSTTDRIQMFTPLPNGAWRASQAGEITVPTSDTRFSAGWYTFTLDPAPRQQPVYFRITTASPGAITVTSVTLAQEWRENLRWAAWHVAVYALALLAITLSLTQLQPLRSRSHFAFVAMLVSFGGYLLWTNGHAPLALGLSNPRLTEAAQEFLAALAVASIAAFHHFYLRDYDPPQAMQRVSLGLALVAATGPVARLIGFGQLSLMIALASYILLVPVLVLLLASLRRDAPIRRSRLRLVYTAYIAVICLNIALRLGLFDSGFLYRNSVMGLSIITSTLILALLWLQQRARQQQDLRRDIDMTRIAAEGTVADTYRTTQVALVTQIDALAQGLAADIGDLAAQGSLAATAPQTLRSVEALRAVIDRCLFALQTQDSRWRVSRTRFDAAVVVRLLALTCGPDTAWRFDLVPAPITSDRVLFQVAARNVLVNALYYGPPDGQVTVSVRPEQRNGQSGVSVTVVNLSTAPDPFDPDKVFERFYRGPSGALHSGTGLGLYLAREALAAIGGQIALTGPAPRHTAATPASQGPQVTADIWVPDR